MPALLDSVFNFLRRPGAAEAIVAGDRDTALEIYAQPDLEDGAPVVDALLSVEKERAKHIAAARQLPDLVKQLTALEQEIQAKAVAEQARRAQFDREQGERLSQKVRLEGQHLQLSMSPHWLLRNLRPDVQAQVKRLAAEAAPYLSKIAQLTEAERQSRTAATRFEQQIEKLESGPLKSQAVTRAEVAQLRKNVAIATGRADDFARQLAHAQAERGAILAEQDAILDRAKRGDA